MTKETIAQFTVVSRIDHVSAMDGSGRQYLGITCGLFTGECAYGITTGEGEHHPFMIELLDPTIETAQRAYALAVEWLQEHASAHLIAHRRGNRS